MKKTAIIISIIVILGGIGAFVSYKALKHVAPTAMQKVAQQTGFTSIQDALNKSLSLQCHFTDESGSQTTAYISAGQVRADIVAKDPNQSGSVIEKDKKVWYWSADKKQGFMMDLANISVTPPVVSGTSEQTATNPADQGTNMMATLEKYKNDCHPAVVDGSLFTPPTDVQFTDMAQMMHQMMPTGGAAIPSNIPAQDQQQYQQMMQQYHVPAQ